MERSQFNIDTFYDIHNKNKKISYSRNFENKDYLYPNGHKITHQMRWFKGSRNRGLRTDNPEW